MVAAAATPPAAAAPAAEPCWYCGGQDSLACPMCGGHVDRAKKLPQTDAERAAAIGRESESLHSMDGWSTTAQCPLRGSTLGRADETPEDLSVRVLCEAEELMMRRQLDKAHETQGRAIWHLEKHTRDTTSIRNRGEVETLCLAWGQRARLLLMQGQEKYEDAQFAAGKADAAYDFIVGDKDPLKLSKHEQKILRMGRHPEGSTYVSHMGVLFVALKLARQCRERVEHGHVPREVMEQCVKVMKGLESLDDGVFVGVESLRAHVLVSRAQSALEMELWENARHDAEAALKFDPEFEEANYLRNAAMKKEW